MRIKFYRILNIYLLLLSNTIKPHILRYFGRSKHRPQTCKSAICKVEENTSFMKIVLLKLSLHFISLTSCKEVIEFEGWEKQKDSDFSKKIGWF